MHLSKPNWGDDNMDGVHLEAYVCETEDPGLCEALVALHCERGCPGGDRESLITALARRIQSAREEVPKGTSPVLVRGVKDCTVVEVREAFFASDESEGEIGGRQCGRVAEGTPACRRAARRRGDRGTGAVIRTRFRLARLLARRAAATPALRSRWIDAIRRRYLPPPPLHSAAASARSLAACAAS